tara:strand:+ start:708 stop:959 length:252 start_codon:yes stop_codon:yes gene_type:complete
MDFKPAAALRKQLLTQQTAAEEMLIRDIRQELDKAVEQGENYVEYTVGKLQCVPKVLELLEAAEYEVENIAADGYTRWRITIP